MIPTTLWINKFPFADKLSGIRKLESKMKIFLTGDGFDNAVLINPVADNTQRLEKEKKINKTPFSINDNKITRFTREIIESLPERNTFYNPVPAAVREIKRISNTIIKQEKVRIINKDIQNNICMVKQDGNQTITYPALQAPVTALPAISKSRNTESSNVFHKNEQNVTFTHAMYPLAITTQALGTSAVVDHSDNMEKFRIFTNDLWDGLKTFGNTLIHHISNPVKKAMPETGMQQKKRVVYGSNPKLSKTPQVLETELDETGKERLPDASDSIGFSWTDTDEEPDYIYRYADNPLMPGREETINKLNPLFADSTGLNSITTNKLSSSPFFDTPAFNIISTDKWSNFQFPDLTGLNSMLTERLDGLQAPEISINQEIRPVDESTSNSSDSSAGKQVYIDRFCDQLVVHIAQADDKGYEQIQDEIRDSLMQIFENYD